MNTWLACMQLLLLLFSSLGFSSFSLAHSLSLSLWSVSILQLAVYFGRTSGPWHSLAFHCRTWGCILLNDTYTLGHSLSLPVVCHWWWTYVTPIKSTNSLTHTHLDGRVSLTFLIVHTHQLVSVFTFFLVSSSHFTAEMRVPATLTFIRKASVFFFSLSLAFLPPRANYSTVVTWVLWVYFYCFCLWWYPLHLTLWAILHSHLLLRCHLPSSALQR